MDTILDFNKQTFFYNKKKIYKIDFYIYFYKTKYIKMTTLQVMATMTPSGGLAEYFGDETGSTEFYMVKHTLEKYLGKENIYVSWDYAEFLFVIEETDEGCDNLYDYSKTIEDIHEPFKNRYMRFEILNFNI